MGSIWGEMQCYKPREMRSEQKDMACARIAKPSPQSPLPYCTSTKYTTVFGAGFIAGVGKTKVRSLTISYDTSARSL